MRVERVERRSFGEFNILRLNLTHRFGGASMTRNVYFKLVITFLSTGAGAKNSESEVSPALSDLYLHRMKSGGAGVTITSQRNFTGSWKLLENINFEAFAASQGVPWALRKLGTLDRPRSVIEHEDSSGRFHHRITEAGRTQMGTWNLLGENSKEDLSRSQRLRNPLFEPVDVTLKWAGRDCPGVIVETHENLFSPRHSIKMYRRLENAVCEARIGETKHNCEVGASRTRMVLTLEAADGTISERVFFRLLPL